MCWGCWRNVARLRSLLTSGEGDEVTVTIGGEHDVEDLDPDLAGRPALRRCEQRLARRARPDPHGLCRGDVDRPCRDRPAGRRTWKTCDHHLRAPDQPWPTSTTCSASHAGRRRRRAQARLPPARPRAAPGRRWRRGDASRSSTAPTRSCPTPQKRARYDRFGDDGSPGSRVAWRGPVRLRHRRRWGSATCSTPSSAPHSVGQAPRAGRGTPQRAARPRRARADRPSRWRRSPTGVRRPVEVEVAVTCSTCSGTGSSTGAGTVACDTCGGSRAGAACASHRFRTARLSRRRVRTCDGSGQDGRGSLHGRVTGDGRRVEQQHRDDRRDTGHRARRPAADQRCGRGRPPRGGVRRSVRRDPGRAPHDRFLREGRDLVADVDVPFTQAALGASLTLPAIGGDEVTAEVRAGAQHGDVVTVRRAGLPGRGRQRPRGPAPARARRSAD